MKNAIKVFVFLLIVCCFAFTTHKFYTAIYQIHFVPGKKEVQITTRIFVDDLNEALEFNYHKKTELGSENESQEDLSLLKKYLSEKFTIKISGKSQPMIFLSKEMEDNILICYLKCKEVTKINSIEVQNTIITEIHGGQQNIIQAHFNDKKASLLLNSETFKGMLK